MQRLDWHGLYGESWQGDLVPEAYAHPAKFSRALIRQIYRYMLAEGMIAPGDKIGDPFGGVAAGALDALRLGLHWRGVELEPRFVELGQDNIELWNGRYAAHFSGWGTAVLVQGDSRNFAGIMSNLDANLLHYVCECGWRGDNKRRECPDCGSIGSVVVTWLDGVDAVVSSPPYASDTVHGRNGIDLDKTQPSGKNSQAATMDVYGTTPGQLGAMPPGNLDAVVSSPPFSPPGNNPTGRGQGVRSDYAGGKRTESSPESTYGKQPGQVGAMPMNDADLDAIVTSPPYGDAIERGDGPGARWDAAGHPGNPDKVSSDASYGDAAGQVGRLDACVSSPPLEESIGNAARVGNAANYTGHRLESYGASEGNIGNNTGDTFWSASRAIVEEVYKALKPGGYAAFVTGDFVRRGKRVYFGQQWLALCTAVGFEPIAWAVAWKTEHHGTQAGLFGDISGMVDRVSFFRRLANAVAHANEHWITLGNETQAAHLADTEQALNDNYNEIIAGMESPILPTWNVTIEQILQFEKDKKQYDRIMAAQKTAKPPTPQKVLQYAKMAAWLYDGEPRLSDAAILNEDVIFVQKPD